MPRFLFLAVALCALGCGGAKKNAIAISGTNQVEATSPDSPTDPNSAFTRGTTILQDYNANEVAADMKYNGKRMQVSVLVGKIAKGESGRYFVGEFYYLNRSAGEPNLICYFSKDKAAPLAKLEPAKLQTILIKGTCKGKKRRIGAEPEFQVFFDECEFVKLVVHSAPAAKPDSIPATERLQRAYARLEPTTRFNDESRGSGNFPALAGNIVEVWGTISSVSADLTKPYVDLKSSRGGWAIRCFFNPGLSDEIKTLQVGRGAVARGTAQRTEPDAEQYEMRDCGIAYRSK